MLWIPNQYTWLQSCRLLTAPHMRTNTAQYAPTSWLLSNQILTYSIPLWAHFLNFVTSNYVRIYISYLVSMMQVLFDLEPNGVERGICFYIFINKLDEFPGCFYWQVVYISVVSTVIYNNLELSLIRHWRLVKAHRRERRPARCQFQLLPALSLSFFIPLLLLLYSIITTIKRPPFTQYDLFITIYYTNSLCTAFGSLITGLFRYQKHQNEVRYIF